MWQRCNSSSLQDNKPGGGGWTWNDIDNLKASIYLYVSGGYCDYVYTGGYPYQYMYVPYPNAVDCDQVWIEVTYFASYDASPGGSVVPEEETVTSGQWNTIYLADNVTVTQGNYYWIAYNSDTAGAVRNTGTGGNRRVKSANHSAYAFPATYSGTGFTSDNLTDTVAGFGLIGSAVITANPGSFSVSGMRGKTDPLSQTMIIANSGGGTLNWSLSKTAAWLTLSSDNGTANGSVTLSENLTGLSAGVYSDNITVTVAGASNSPLIMPVTLTVTSGGDSTFVYDGNGQRIRKTENGQTILYINRYFEKNLKTGEVTTYYYMGGRLVSMRKGASLMYVHQDHLTGTSLMSDSTGAQVGTTMKYYPFGGLRSGSVPTDIKFTGQRLDDSGLYYYGARYYDPQIGRFISADPYVQISVGLSMVSKPLSVNPVPQQMGKSLTSDLQGPYEFELPAFCSQALNRYSYVQNTPLTAFDPTGYNSSGLGIGLGIGLAVICAAIAVVAFCAIVCPPVGVPLAATAISEGAALAAGGSVLALGELTIDGIIVVCVAIGAPIAGGFIGGATCIMGSNPSVGTFPAIIHSPSPNPASQNEGEATTAIANIPGQSEAAPLSTVTAYSMSQPFSISGRSYVAYGLVEGLGYAVGYISTCMNSGNLGTVQEGENFGAIMNAAGFPIVVGPAPTAPDDAGNGR